MLSLTASALYWPFRKLDRGACCVFRLHVAGCRPFSCENSNKQQKQKQKLPSTQLAAGLSVPQQAPLFLTLHPLMHPFPPNALPLDTFSLLVLLRGCVVYWGPGGAPALDYAAELPLAAAQGKLAPQEPTPRQAVSTASSTTYAPS